MPVAVDDVETLRQYIRGVIADAEHHANNVEQIVLTLAGAIISRKDADASLEVRLGKGGGLGRALTTTIRGNRYAFSYDHENKCINVKDGSYQGSVIRSFTNATPLSEVASFFRDL